MILVSSANGGVGMRPAMDLLLSGGSALDAVEVATREVERNPNDHSVGLGGLPNVLGEVRLDALIMDGRTLRGAAVGSVRNVVHAVTLARRLMERMPHVLLVGDGAERFAREIGMEAEDPLTTEAAAAWREGLLGRFPGLDLSRLAERPTLADLVEGLNDPMAGWNLGHGTVDFLAQDRDGNLATAVSTSGWSFGYPGRLGDAPVIGAAGYADNRWGAAASTGTGEVTLRTSACRSVILYLKLGWSLVDALEEALKDLRDLRDPYVEHIALIGLDRSGRHVGYSHRPNERYLYMTDAMSEPAEAESHYVSSR